MMISIILWNYRIHTGNNGRFMDIGSVMAIVDGSLRSRAVLRAALDLGRTFDARTHLLQISPAPVVLVPRVHSEGANAIDDMVNSLQGLNEHRRLQFERFFEEDVIANGTPVCRHRDPDPQHCTGFGVCKELVTGHESREIAKRGRLVDIVLMVTPSEDDGGVDSAVLEATLFDTGRPALLIPGTYDGHVGRCITIAWDGSAEAAKSIHNAMPLISRAKHVDVLNVQEDGRLEADPNDIATYLTTHGINATATSVKSAQDNVAETLMKAASSNGDAMIVMGAYGDNPMNLGVYGNTARVVVGTAINPIFIAH